MRWYKHDNDDRNKIESKLIKAKFGAEGYGIFTALKEMVGEYITSENYLDWGHISPLHDVQTIADECCTTPEKMKAFLKFCDEKNILEKDEKGLFYKDILDRVDDFAERVRREYGQGTNKVRTKSDIEEKRIDKKRTEQKRGEYSPVFEEFWKLYPKKVGKPKTYELWNDLTPADHARIIEDVPRRGEDDKWINGFVKDPERYVKWRQWEDEIIKPRKKQGETKSDKF